MFIRISALTLALAGAFALSPGAFADQVLHTAQTTIHTAPGMSKEQLAAKRFAEEYGAPGDPKKASMTIVLGDVATRLHVKEDDTVTITKGGKSFTWTFSAIQHEVGYPLATIAPKDFDSGKVKVYVHESDVEESSRSGG